MEAKKIEIQESGDPIANFLKKWADKIITWLLAFAVIFLFVKFYFDAKETNLKQASDNLQSLQSVVKELETTPNKDKENTLKDNIKTLKESVAPYNKIAEAYNARLIAKNSDINKKLDYLTKSNWANEKSESRLFDELSFFTVARSLIDTDKISEAEKSLENLVKNGKFMNLSALEVLLKLDSNKFKKLKEEFVSAHPEQAELLK